MTPEEFDAAYAAGEPVELFGEPRIVFDFMEGFVRVEQATWATSARSTTWRFQS